MHATKRMKDRSRWSQKFILDDDGEEEGEDEEAEEIEQMEIEAMEAEDEEEDAEADELDDDMMDNDAADDQETEDDIKVVVTINYIYCILYERKLVRSRPRLIPFPFSL